MPSDPRATAQRMVTAKYTETKDLIRRGTFKVILKEEIPEISKRPYNPICPCRKIYSRWVD